MLRFQFTETPFGQIEEEHQLEKKIAKLYEYTPKERLALLHNDARNYLLCDLHPTFDAWYLRREYTIREYATFDWVKLGKELSNNHFGFSHLCQEIHTGLQQLVHMLDQTRRFDVALLCHIFSKIDYLWSILLPSHYTAIIDPHALVILQYFGISSSA